MRLWLVRHAPVLIEPGRCYGASDLGAHEALTHDAAVAAANVLPPHTPVTVSGLRRAQQLAHAIAALRPDLAPVRIDQRLNEMNFGTWELQPWDDIPRMAMDAWVADFGCHRFGGGECAQDVLDRVADAITECTASGIDEGVWIAHAGVIRSVLYFRDHGREPIRDASQWPKDSVEPGGHVCVEV